MTDIPRTSIVQLHSSEEQQRIAQEQWKRTGGGGNDGGMSDDWKQGVDRQLGQLNADVRSLLVQSAVLEERTKHLPTKPYIFVCLAGLLTAIGVLVALLIRFIPPAHP
ncbi:hypothetical protein [Sphingomonas hengshuiensis]|uniref:hypothetical protein n=1 Tax=Sphingomonas hengshuiensis TaxID=1609977 RepID=UPI0012B98C08|nr:hypothetical protein [Sphingomonas hengshuiensis]